MHWPVKLHSECIRESKFTDTARGTAWEQLHYPPWLLSGRPPFLPLYYLKHPKPLVFAEPPPLDYNPDWSQPILKGGQRPWSISDVAARTAGQLEGRPSGRLYRYAWVGIIGIGIAVWILNVSRVGAQVTGCPDGCATTGERGDGPLRVMSLNVLHGFPRFEHVEARLGLIADEIRRQDADIVCLQEVPWTLRLGNAAEHLVGRTGLNHLYLRANGNRWAILFEEGEAILSRYPLRDASFAELEPRAGLFEHRAVLQATAMTPWGSVRVFATHLTNGDAEINRAQAASLGAFVAAQGEGLAIVAGDFNATEDAPQIQALAGQWLDAYPVVHPGDEGLTCCIGDVSQGPEQRLEERIDYVFLVPEVRRSASVVSIQRVLDRPSHTLDGWLWASDHVGLVAAIGIGR